MKVGELDKSKRPSILQSSSQPVKVKVEETNTAHILPPEEGTKSEMPPEDIYEGLNEDETDLNMDESDLETFVVEDNSEEPKENTDVKGPISVESFPDELRTLVKQAAGPFYANYIQHFKHPNYLTPEVEKMAADRLISFCKILLTKLG